MKKFNYYILSLALIFGIVVTIQTNSIDAKKADVVVKNTKNNIVSITKYHNNDKVAYLEKITYHNNGKVNKKTIVKRNEKGQKTYDYSRVNNKNGKAKKITTYSNYYNGAYKKREIKKYQTNGKINFKEIVKRNNSLKKTNTTQYHYNKKGQLKTNKNGSAKRVVYKYFNNGKISSKTTHKYNAKGKLYGKVVNTKSYLKNKPLSIGENIAKKGKTFIGDNMVCTEFVSKTLVKAGFKLNNDNWTYSFGIVNGHMYKHVFYEPVVNKNSKVFVIKNSKSHKSYKKYINDKNYIMSENKLISVNNQNDLKKQLKVGDIINYNDGAHYAIYIGNNQAVQGGLADKKGKYQRVGIAPLNLGSSYKITEIVRIIKF